MKIFISLIWIALYFVIFDASARLCASDKYSNIQAAGVGAAMSGLFYCILMGVGYYTNGKFMLINGSGHYSALAGLVLIFIGGLRCFASNKKFRRTHA